ncbi:sulfur oxidation c-type cytochrome SoxA [Sulfurimonas sp.]
MKVPFMIFTMIFVAIALYFMQFDLNDFQALNKKSEKFFKNVKSSIQYSMTNKDRAIYEDMQEDNPADIMLSNGELIFNNMGGEKKLASFLEIKEKDLPKYIAGFPRYNEKIGMVVGLDQVIQALAYDAGYKKTRLSSSSMFSVIAYVKSLANDERINIDIKENIHLYESYTLGKNIFHMKRGGRGLSCFSCHSQDIVDRVLRTQKLPNLGDRGVAAGATWPAYRMTKSSLRTLQRRFQGCMKNSLMKVLPLGSAEMVALEVYVTKKALGHKIAIPGLKR